ncbi:MAG TPA: tetratricopeptide repeat protein [Magnetovibrio sp.]
MTAQDNIQRAAPDGSATATSNEPPDSRLAEAKRIYEHALDHHRAGRFDEAIKDYGRVLSLSPLSADVYNNLGVALRAAGRAHAAVACYRRALALKPGVAGVYTNLGNALNDLGEAARAAEAHRRAVKFAPKSPKALLGAGVALRNIGQAAAALDHFNQAIKLEPTYALCRVEHATTLLQMGDWQRGFKELEIRFALPGRDPRRKDLAAWNGSPLKGETILINFEGSVGTAVQFARFASTLKHMNANVVMECPAHLAHLLSAAPDIDATLHTGAPLSGVPDHLPPVSAQVPLLSLPARLGVEVDKLPAESAYLSVPKFGGTTLDIHPETRLAVGLVWSGSWDGRQITGPANAQDMVLEDFGEILGVPGLQVFSLERGAGASDISRLGLQPLIQPVGASLMDAADLAVVIDQLDLIICVDSPAAHIAGALGKPVWMLAGPGSDWSWLLDRTDSPWYPSMRLFRRELTERWTDTVSHVRKALMDVLKGDV